MTFRCLMVEDFAKDANRVRRALERIEKDELKKRNLELSCRLCKSAKSAEDCLRKAASARKPWDVLILDLELPSHDGSKPATIENGYWILEVARLTGGARKVLICSHLDDYRCVLDLLGKYDGLPPFVAKADLATDLGRAILGLLDDLLKDKSQQIFAERAKWLLPFAEKALAEEFSKSVSRLLDSSCAHRESLERDICDRFGVDVRSDKEDSLAKLIKEMAVAEREFAKEWQGRVMALGDRTRGRSEVLVFEELKSVLDELFPCLHTHGVDLKLQEMPQTKIYTYSDDFRTVVREIILGTILGATEKKTPIQVDVQAHDRGEGRLDIVFQGNLPPVATEDRNLINALSGSCKDVAFGRIWGLLQCQLILRCYSHRLDISTKAKHTSITYKNY